MTNLHTVLSDLASWDSEIDFELVDSMLRDAMNVEPDMNEVLATHLRALPPTFAGFVLRVAAAAGHREALNYVEYLLTAPEPLSRMDAAAACVLLDDPRGEPVLSDLLDYGLSGQPDPNGHVVALHWVTDMLDEIGDHPIAVALRMRIREAFGD